MQFYLVLLFCGCFSRVCGSEHRRQDEANQVLLQELHSRVLEMEIVIKNQNQIIQDQNYRIAKLEKLTMIGSSHGEFVENSNLVVETTDRGMSKLADPMRGSNQTVHGLVLEKVRLPGRKPQQGKQRIRRGIEAGQPIAFYAHMSGHLRSPGGHHTLIFDTVKTNEGKGYHHNIGVFMAPASGTYFFTWTMSLGASASLSTELVVNTVPHGSIYIHTSSDQRDSATGNLILSLNAGDEVFIRTGDSFSSAQILSDEYSRTDFSGFLIE
ncbi:cerebellin-3-like [Saccostrea cucullata]|uniref:cerebellin-3-like n=1 Tax=Saccostrea cuccullata TaxID=36930 RepID=UPI002ED1DF6D